MPHEAETAPLLADDARSDHEVDSIDEENKPSRLDRLAQWLKANIVGVLIVALLLAGLIALIIYFASAYNRLLLYVPSLSNQQ